MSKNDKDPRTYDDEGYKRRAGCVCVKDENRKEVLLVSSSKCVNRWIVPAGAIGPGEDPLSAALREVEEEAGVKGRVDEFLGVFQNDVSKSRTYIYILRVDQNFSHLKSQEDRQRRWFSIEEACNELSHKPVQKLYLLKLSDKNSTKKSEDYESKDLNHFLKKT